MLSRLATNQYEDDELITLKISMKLPYLTDDDDYRPATGEVEHDGEFYKLVKQKQVGDTLIIICIKNHEEKNLVKRMTDYANLSNDLPAQSKDAQNILCKLVKEYASSLQKDIILTKGWTAIQSAYTIPSLSLSIFESSVQAPPPKSVS